MIQQTILPQLIREVVFDEVSIRFFDSTDIAKLANTKELSVPTKKSNVSKIIDEHPKKLDDMGSISQKKDLDKKDVNGNF